MKSDIYQRVTDQIIASLETGIRPWMKPWSGEHAAGRIMLAGKLPPTETFELRIPVKATQGLRTKDLQRVQGALCYRFAESLVVSDSTAALGERLFVFYGAGNGRDYSGTYRSEIGTADVAEPEFAGYSEINIAADTGFWRVTEKTAPDLDHAIYDGVLVCSGDAAVVVLKDRVAGVARNYMLWPESETLQGHGATMRFLPGDTTEVWDKFKISGIEPIEIRLRKI